MTTVLTYGTFDLLHVGHINLLERARGLGDRLIVGLSSDNFNSRKGKTCIYPFPERKRILEAIRHVDTVIIEKSWEQKVEDVRRHRVDIFAMGDDWLGEFDFLSDFCEVVYLPRTPGISTTYFKDRIVYESRESGVVTVEKQRPRTDTAGES
jgi:glycerol-3-phosphate cytidylyltransferase